MKKTNILLIYTGGTIGMVKDYDSGALKAFNFKKLLKNIPELEQLDCHIDSVSFKNPIDSSNINTDHWIDIASIIESHYESHDGFVVLHGSDTMSYSASALSYMLENLAKPVIFTGSQLPIGDLRTDAKENLITSIQIAALQKYRKSIVQEVGLYFEYKLYRGNRTTKINAEHFEAFASLNHPAFGRVWCAFKRFNESLLKSVLKIPNLKALVLETYGAGNAPTEPWFIGELKKAIKNGLHIVNVTQCSGGGVIMGQYETSEQLQKMQVINGKDITTEAAITKLMYLLGSNISSKTFKTIFETSLRGEMQ
ncbi:L-asparaginase 1 [Nymphon striatum]|nr:L-asparaginase 1 [Nymphon striatum]